MRNIPKETIEKAALGDMGAFEEIYKAFSGGVYAVALGITQNRQDAEEAAQDVFVKIYRTIKGFKFESSFGTWVYRIATNAAINIYHSRARHRKKAAAMEEAGEIPDSGFERTKEALEREDASSKVAQLLRILSPEHRSCIVLRELEGLEYGQIADVLKIPINTVRSRLKRAREALIAYCRKEGACYETSH